MNVAEKAADTATSGLINIPNQIPNISYTINSNSRFKSKNRVFMKTLKRFFEQKDHVKTFLEIVNEKSHISLRILDYLVTIYSNKQKNKLGNYIMYQLYDESSGQYRNFNIHMEYKSQLKAYSKKHFDAFRRNERIEFCVDGQSIETTVAQLNFFRWAISNGLIEYATLYYNEIEGHMNAYDNGELQDFAKNYNPQNNKLIDQLPESIDVVDVDAVGARGCASADDVASDTVETISTIGAKSEGKKHRKKHKRRAKIESLISKLESQGEACETGTAESATEDKPAPNPKNIYNVNMFQNIVIDFE